MIQYFFFKDGGGNAWLEFSLQQHLLYIGFDDTWFKAIERADARLGQGESAPSRTDLSYLDDSDFSGAKQDVDLLHRISHGDLHADARLITFSPTELIIWRSSGALRELHPTSSEWKTMRSHWLRYCLPVGERRTRARRTAIRDAQRLVIREGLLSTNALDKLRRYSYFDESDLDHPDETKLRKRFKKRYGSDAQPGPTAVRVLPVEVVCRVPRRELFTSVDSISVYRNLNSNTCTPLRTVRGTDPDNPNRVDTSEAWPLSPPPEGMKPKDETPYGYFLRLYLNEILHRRRLLPADEPRLNMELTQGGLRTLIPWVLNPILVETAALALVRDVGLTPDIGIGKGMDVVDVRARAVGPDGALDRSIAKAAAEKLRRFVVLMGLSPEIHDGWITNLRKFGVLDIQCKARDTGLFAAPDRLLFIGYPLGPTSADTTLPTIDVRSLGQIRVGSEYPELSRFFPMQAQVLAGTWRDLDDGTRTHNP